MPEKQWEGGKAYNLGPWRQDSGDNQSSGMAREAAGGSSYDSMTATATSRNRGLNWRDGGKEGAATGTASYPIRGSRGGLAPEWVTGRGMKWGNQDGSRYRANDKFIIRESKKAQWPSERTHAAMQNPGWCNYRLTRR